MTSLPLNAGLFRRSICLGLLETCPRLGRQEKPSPEGSLSWIQRLSGCWPGEGERTPQQKDVKAPQNHVSRTWVNVPSQNRKKSPWQADKQLEISRVKAAISAHRTFLRAWGPCGP